jgi:aspartyl-tRNA(Asn)/glutamyl-tRNA(Gln) amidotransferase subunit A
LKTTWGRISNEGVLPLSSTLDTVGPMTRSVEDAALLYNAMTDIKTTAPVLPVGQMRGISGLRLAQMPAEERNGVDAEVLAAYDTALAELARLGAEIVSPKLPYGLADVAEVSGTIMCSEAYAVLGDLVDDDDLKLDPYSRAFVLKGRGVTARDYLAALARRQQLQADFYAALSGIDAFLTPTTRNAALTIDGLDQRQTPSQFTRFVNLLNLCAAVVPNGFTATGLPTSLQIAGLPYGEDMVLRIAHSYQAVTPWHTRRPGGIGLS